MRGHFHQWGTDLEQHDPERRSSSAGAAFTAAAAQAGVRSTSALPLRLHGQVIGALNLFSIRRDSFSTTSLAWGQAMADLATIGLLNERSLREQALLPEQLQAALRSRAVIEQAQGVLAARNSISIEDAFARLRQHARSRKTTLTQVATGVVNGQLRLDPQRVVKHPVATDQAAGRCAPGHRMPAAPSRTGSGSASPVSSAAGVAGSGSPASRSDWVLSPLDLQILRMIAAGRTGAAVAHRLAIPITDVTLRMIFIRARLGATSTAGAVQVAHRDGVI